MSIPKKVGICFLACLLILGASVIPISARAEFAPFSPASLSAQSAILIEAESGRVLASKNADLPLAMASTTKIMTALVALELAEPDTVITVDPLAVGVEGSSIYLSAGEELTLEQLLYALLLRSANDAAAAIAIGLCGSIEAFAEQMNCRAKDLGLVATHFTNPHGLDDDDHYTTARELAIISRAALQVPLIRKISSTYKANIPQNGVENARLLVNHNKLLRRYEGCIGLKTGYTKKSGRSLVSAAERDGVTLIAVTINAPDDWNDHTALLDYGFSQLSRVALATKGEMLYALPIVGGTNDYVLLQAAEDCQITLPRTVTEIDTVIECRRFEFAEIRQGDTLGRALFLADTDGDGKKEVLKTVSLYAAADVAKVQTEKGFMSWFRGLFSS